MSRLAARVAALEASHVDGSEVALQRVVEHLRAIDEGHRPPTIPKADAEAARPAFLEALRELDRRAAAH